MKERGRYQIQFMKTRSSSGVGQKVDLEFNVDTLRITDLGDEADLTPQPTSSQIYQGLKRTSTIAETTDPSQGISINKLKQPGKGSNDIRSMLANLNSEKD
jgi:hypothetical protein